MSFSDKYGPWALVTGAGRAEGIGFEFAQQIAAKGVDLILVDVLGDEVAARAKEIRDSHGVDARPVGLDLGRRDFLDDLLAEVDEREVGLLVCNHMFTPKDTPTFLSMDLATLDAMLDINARAYTHLVHAFGNEMVARGRGGIVLVSSGAGVTAAPYTTPYSANKGYQRLLGEGLWYELQGTGVDVLVVTPGLTNTQGDALSDYPSFMLMEAEPVVREALEGLGKELRLVPGPLNKAFMFLQSRVLPVKTAVRQLGDIMGKGLKK
jgi:short-subunit dehydrogenase